MTVTINNSIIAGSLIAPASKSSMQRVCAAALLHNGVTTIYNPGNSNDDIAAKNIIQLLGAKIIERNNCIEIISNGLLQNSIAENTIINCGESGLSIRMFAPIVALVNNNIFIEGSGSLLQRPMNFFDEIFPKLGVQIFSNNGKLPLQIKGDLQPKNIEIDGSLSSQFLTGLLFAFGQIAKEEVIITVNDLKSKPYIDLTLTVMQEFGFMIENILYKNFIIHAKKNFEGERMTYTVEGDWSSASFLLVAGAIAGTVAVKGLDVHSTQADKAILQVLKQCKARITIAKNEITISKSELLPFEFDATDCPDLFPPLVALAAYCKGTSTIYGVYRLAAKESERAKTLQEVFGKMGIKITLQNNDTMLIEGGQIIGANVSSHHDHRIAMASAVAALGSSMAVSIQNFEAINKSYPTFLGDMKKLGASVFQY